jgi:UDP-glucose 4-epimerase
LILITGGMGFIGLHTAKAFLDAGEDVVVTKFRTTREPSFIKEHIGKRFFAETVDITNPFDMIEVARKHKVTGIVHLAVPAVGAVGGQSVAEDYRVNMMGLINVLEAGRIAGVKRVSLASSSTVYGGTKLTPPFTEDAPLMLTAAQTTPAFKKAFEVLGDHYGVRTGLDVISLRITGIYGPLYHSMTNLPSRLVHAAIKGVPGPLSRPGQAIPYEDDISDLTYAKDCAKGIQMLQMATGLKHKVYNVGTGAAIRNGDLAEAVRKLVPGAQMTLQPGRSPTAPPNSFRDITRLKDDTGYTPQYTVESGVADYLDWLRAGNAA